MWNEPGKWGLILRRINRTYYNLYQATTQATEQIESLLKYCEIPKSRSEMQEFMKLNNREHFRKSILIPLIKGELLKLTMPDKSTSPKQKYYSERK